jgi:phenylacetate-CoA ligase
VFPASAPAEDRLAEFPLLEKAQLREMANAAVARDGARQYFTAETSGSTGVSLRVPFGRDHFVSYYARLAYLLWQRGLWPARYSMCMMTVSAFRAIVDYTVLQPAINDSFYRRLNIHPSRWRSPAAAVQAVASEQPLILRGMPTSLQALARDAAEFPPSSPIRPSLVISTAETLLPTTRQALQDAFGASVIDEYGLSEVGGIVGWECLERGGFHVLSVDYVVEVVDRNGATQPDGVEGEIVITNLYSLLVPLVRYRTGDYGTLNRDVCRCGSSAPRIARLTGRALSRFVRPGGSSYNPFDEYGRRLLALPVTQFQMVQAHDSRIVLRYCGDRDVSGLPEVLALRGQIAAIHGDQAGLHLERVNRFEEGPKFQAFLRDDQRPAAAGNTPAAEFGDEHAHPVH